jgi:DNA-binding XRE family transcriptional regulator
MSSTPLEPLAMIPGGMWDQVGWWDQVERNRRKRYDDRYATGLRLRDVRRSLGITGAAITRHLGLCKDVVSQWENGYKPIPTYHVAKIEGFLGRSITDKAA